MEVVLPEPLTPATMMISGFARAASSGFSSGRSSSAIASRSAVRNAAPSCGFAWRTVSSSLRVAATPQSACNYMIFKNPEFDKIMDEAGQSDDSAKRTQLLQKANALLYDEAPVWFFNYNKAVMAVQPWLHGVQLNATELTHQNVEELWVDETSPAK